MTTGRINQVSIVGARAPPGGGARATAQAAHQAPRGARQHASGAVQASFFVCGARRGACALAPGRPPDLTSGRTRGKRTAGRSGRHSNGRCIGRCGNQNRDWGLFATREHAATPGGMTGRAHAAVPMALFRGSSRVHTAGPTRRLEWVPGARVIGATTDNTVTVR